VILTPSMLRIVIVECSRKNNTYKGFKPVYIESQKG
jgi:hypothetical protein